MATNWNVDNRAAGTTWFNARTLEQIDAAASFSEAKSIKMSEMTFWNALSSGEARRVQAGSLAAMMDNINRQFWFARYAHNADRATAIESIVATLLNQNKTLLDLAEVADQQYDFGEAGDV